MNGTKPVGDSTPQPQRGAAAPAGGTQRPEATQPTPQSRRAPYLSSSAKAVAYAFFGVPGEEQVKGKEHSYSKGIWGEMGIECNDLPKVVAALERLFARGDVTGDELFEALCTGMSDEKKERVRPEKGAKRDFLGGKDSASVAEVVDAANRFLLRVMGNIRAWDDYRDADVFISMPSSAIERMLYKNPLFERWYQTFKRGDPIRFSEKVKLYLELTRSEESIDNDKRKEFEKKVALRLLLDKFVERCREEEIDLRGLDMNDPMVGARFVAMLLDMEMRQQLGEKKDVKYELKFLREFQKAGAAQLLDEKYKEYIRRKTKGKEEGGSVYDNIHFYRDVMHIFHTEVFGSNWWSLSASEIEAKMREMTPEKWDKLFAKLEERSKEMDKKGGIPVAPEQRPEVRSVGASPAGKPAPGSKPPAPSKPPEAPPARPAQQAPASMPAPKPAK